MLQPCAMLAGGKNIEYRPRLLLNFSYNIICLNFVWTLANKLTRLNYRFLAEPEDGPGDNYWIVDQLLQRLGDKSLATSNLEGPHYGDQWWIGARSYVSIRIFYMQNSALR